MASRPKPDPFESTVNRMTRYSSALSLLPEFDRGHCRLSAKQKRVLADRLRRIRAKFNDAIAYLSADPIPDQP